MKKFSLVLAVMAMAILIWYLFLRSYEYAVSFEAETTPGDIIETIRIWDRAKANMEIVKVDSFNTLDQKVIIDERVYKYTWEFSMIDDSTTKVKIRISQPDKKFINKIMIPFSNQPIENDAYAIANEFYDILQTHLKITDVKILGVRELDPEFCVCQTNIKTRQIEKANGMMEYYGLLTSFISTYGLKGDGPPIVRIKSWSHNQDSLTFDFCFPIVKTDSLPKVQNLVYKDFEGVRAVGAIYNGNYITSDRAWYSLIQYAWKNDISVKHNPIEYFYNNPNLGIKQEEWKAEVYLPIK